MGRRREEIKGDELRAVRELHRRAFGHWPAHTAWAPGWMEWLGEMTASQEGLVLASAVNRYVTAAISPRADGRIECVHGDEGQRVGFWVHRIESESDVGWANDITGTLAMLRRKRVHFSGFNLALHDEIPFGWDLGRRGAWAVAVALALRRMFPFSVDELGAGLAPRRDQRGEVPPLGPAERLILARWLRQGGLGSERGRGGAGPLPALMGRAWHAMAVDCRFWTLDHLPLVGEALVVLDTARQPGRDEARGEFIRETMAAAAALRARSLRSVDPAYLKANRGCLTERQQRIAYYVVGEIQRVVFAERALREDDPAQAGHFLSLSQESARSDLGNHCPEADRAAELAQQCPGCRGSRVLGGGWCGQVLCLVPYHQAERFVNQVATLYARVTGGTLQAHVLPAVDGAG